MPDPNAPLCDCRTLERAAAEPDNPIVFDEELNEYQIRYGQGGRMMIYHCPFCGGRTPKSKRGSLFAQLTRHEIHRLTELTSKFTILSEVTAAFGSPDEDQAAGEWSTTPEEDGKPETTTFRRTLTYKSLSQTANVCVRIYPDDRVGFSFHGKYLGKTEDQAPR